MMFMTVGGNVSSGSSLDTHTHWARLTGLKFISTKNSYIFVTKISSYKNIFTMHI